MSFLQSGWVAMTGGSLAKRAAFLVAQACGMSRRDADFASDEIAIVASQTLGTACSILTLDPGGFGLTIAHTALLENDLQRKRTGLG